MNNVFGLDIGTRNVVGTVGHRTEDGAFIVEAQYVRQHETRSMLDGQIHDIGKVARTISAVKAELEAQLAACRQEQESCGSDYVRLQALTAEQERLTAELDAKTERWVYLNDLKERIDAQ